MPLPDAARHDGLTLVSREECGLCEDMMAAVERLRATRPLPPLRILDVDADADLRRRYGLHVPVLLLDGVEVSRHRLDEAELTRLLRRR
jgi:hypothetical protein